MSSHVLSVCYAYKTPVKNRENFLKHIDAIFDMCTDPDVSRRRYGAQFLVAISESGIFSNTLMFTLCDF